MSAPNEISPDEENVWTGRRYYSEWDVFEEALSGPVYTKKIETDQWGAFITGAAPIKMDGETVAIIGIDMDYSDF